MSPEARETGSREKELFGEAMDLPTDERTRLLDRACADDPRLRERVVRLLELHDGAGAFLIEPACLTRAEPGRQVGPEDLSGLTIGRFTLLSRLGEGGFGVVYVGEQERPVRRRVAVKMLKAGMDSRRVIARFEGERRTLARMEHPGIARIFDAGESDAGRPYFVMELVDGEPITSWCARTGMSIEARLALFERVCLAVQHAHAKGVIHRDLKPSNVLVTEVDGRPEPKVIDFGIAKAVEADQPGATALTEARQVIGTPEYMAPEQAGASEGAVDTRTDVYALGALLYELLTGQPAFDRSRVRNASFAQLERILRDEQPLRPSARFASATEHVERARRMARRLRGDLDWIVMRAMAKDPERRYPTAYALAQDLRRHLASEPVEAGPPSRVYRLRKLARRHRPQAIGAGIALAALAALVVFSIWFARDRDRAMRLAQGEQVQAMIARDAAQRRAGEAERARARANREVAKYRSIDDLVRGMFGSLDPAKARGADTSLLRTMLLDARDRLGASDPAPEVEAEVLAILGHAALSIADYDLAEPMLRRSVTLSEASIGPASAQTVEAQAGLGQLLTMTSRFDEAERVCREVLGRTETLYGPDDERSLRAAGNLVGVLLEGGKWSEACAALERLVVVQARVLGPEHDTTLTGMNNLATAYSRLEREEKAVELYRRVYEAQLARHGPDNPKTLMTLNNLATSEEAIGRTDLAAERHTRILEAKRRVLDPRHPSLAVTMNNLASLLAKEGEDERAEAMFLEAMGIMRASLGETDLRTLMLANNLAGFYRDRDRFAESEALLRPAFSAARETHADHPMSLEIAHSLAGLLLQTARYREGSEVESWAIEHASEDDPRRGSFLTMRARLLVGMGRLDDAAALLAEASASTIEAYPPEHPRARLYAKAMAELLTARGRTDEAALWRERAGPDD